MSSKFASYSQSESAQLAPPYSAAIATLEGSIDNLRHQIEHLYGHLQPYMGGELVNKAGDMEKSPSAASEALETVYRLTRQVEAIESAVTNLRSRLVI